MRVLLVSAQAPDADGIGGVPVHLADSMLHAGSRVSLWAGHHRAGTLVVGELGRQWRELGRFRARELSGAVQAALAAVGAEVLHVHSPELGPTALAAAARANRVRCIATLHDVNAAGPASGPLLRACDRIVVPSSFMQRRVLEHHPGLEARIRIVHWGVTPQARVVPGARGGPLRVAVVGVFHPDKGAHLLPELMRATAPLGIEWHLYGATEGRSLSAVRRAAPRLLAHGAYRRSELGRELARARIDVALLASTVPEAFCLTLSECVAAAVPVVASDIGALGERVRHERCGWLFDPTRPESLHELLFRLADRAELCQLAREMTERVPRTPAEMALDLTRLYLELEPSGGVERNLGPVALRTRRPPRSVRALSALRHSKFYRDLPLRRVLPETLRARVEERVRALARWLL
ncbi:MAG: glycosyltransferase [Polyangiaceae bacterium]